MYDRMDASGKEKDTQEKRSEQASGAAQGTSRDNHPFSF